LDAKELNGDIVSNVDDAMIFLKKHLRLAFRIETVRRENILELPEDALREAVINAVCHRDYFEKGARVMVEIYDDRVDIVSPGGVCKGITRENFGAISITRNSVVASMLYRIGYIEQMGTGIRRMKMATQEAKVAEPEFDFSGFFKVTFKRSEPEQSNGTNGKQSNNERIASRKQANNERIILSHLTEHGHATVADFAGIFNLSEARIRAILSEMVKEGMIEKIGKTKSSYYMLRQK
jgi:ATP-dependent DNA helicase RecG